MTTDDMLAREALTEDEVSMLQIALLAEIRDLLRALVVAQPPALDYFRRTPDHTWR